METDLLAIIQKAKKGDEKALSMLLTAYRPMINHAISFYYSGLSAVGFTMEDLQQECSVALFKAVEQFDGERGVSFGAFAKRCVRNRLISIYRANHKKERKAKKDFCEIQAAPAVFVDRTEWIYALENKLTAYEKQVWSYYSKGYKPAEIAKLLGRDVKSVYNSLCRIRAKASLLERS
ncbi:MAG: sigma-70 family RNA polymerase sigma factor [Clostridiales bacterium]|nr:sigma-70 family RNA polymerase sigma factor [Clostridiales bacterium]